jgi:hypothetical protein
MADKATKWKVIAIIEAIIIVFFIALIVFFFIGNGPKDKKKMIIVKPQYSEVLSTITCDAAARMFFEACAKEDWETVQKLYPIQIDDDFKDYLGGLQIINLGKSYKSKLFFFYPGRFIHYEIKLTNGEIKKWRLAIRNDNKFRVWRVDGGI